MKYLIVRRTLTADYEYFIIDVLDVQQFDFIVFVGASPVECEVYASQNNIPVKSI